MLSPLLVFKNIAEDSMSAVRLPQAKKKHDRQCLACFL
jgi:hypothetical protein